MSTTGRPDAPAPSASEAAARLREAGLVRLAATPDGDALAATGVLARALADADVAFQAGVGRPGPGTDADLTVTVGRPGGDMALAETPASAAAHAVAAELSAADPTLALAGAVAAGDAPGEHAALLDAADLERRPGVAAPVADLADGLAHSTLVHAPFSGSTERARAALADLDRSEDEGRTVASMVALEAVRGAPERAAESVERALHPYGCDRFETLGGYADVLDAVARESPGTGVALALGHEVADAALSAWRSHAERAHAALGDAEPMRYDGLTVAPVGDAPLGTVARLLFEYRAREPVALAAGDRAAAVHAAGDVEAPFRAAAEAAGGEVTVRTRVGRVEDVDPEQFATAFREALS